MKPIRGVASHFPEKPGASARGAKKLCPINNLHLAAGEGRGPGFNEFIPIYSETLNICSKLHGNSDSRWDTYGSIPACR